MRYRMSRRPGLLAGMAAGLVLWAAFLPPRPAAAAPGVAPSARHPIALDTVPTERVRSALAQWQPALLRAPRHDVMVYFVANRAGVVQKSLVVPLDEMQHGVVSGSRQRSAAWSRKKGVAVDGTDYKALPRATLVPGRNVVAEIRADVAPRRIDTVVMWTSQAVPGGVLVGWVTLQD